jgi:CheY-like chemotaxis protein
MKKHPNENSMNSHTKPPTILWADDDPDDIAIMREVLQNLYCGHHVVEVYNGRQALDYLQQAQEEAGQLPCLIVLDMNMPVLSGRETLVALKQDPVFKEIPTVVFTTSKSPLDKAFCERHGTDMLTKPMTFESLKEAMKQLLSLCDVSS